MVRLKLRGRETFNLKHWDSWETKSKIKFDFKFKFFRQKNRNRRLTDRYQDQESADIAHYQPIVPTRTFIEIRPTWYLRNHIKPYFFSTSTLLLRKQERQADRNHLFSLASVTTLDMVVVFGLVRPGDKITYVFDAFSFYHYLLSSCISLVVVG
jgi:hypothetical protein